MRLQVADQQLLTGKDETTKGPIPTKKVKLKNKLKKIIFKF